MSNLSVGILAKDFHNASYISIDNCPLARALKRKFPDVEVTVGGITANIVNCTYNIMGDWCCQYFTDVKRKMDETPVDPEQLILVVPLKKL